MARLMVAIRTGPHRQRGVVSIVIGLTILMLMLVLGLVLDLGHLYIVKTELQNAADACALSAARELAIINTETANNARKAGKGIGGLHNVNFQADPVDIQDSDITFSASADTGWGDAVASDTRYVKCTPHGTNVKSVAMWFMVMAGIDSWNMSAFAVARLGPSQTHCALPLAVCAKSPVPAGDPYWGLTKGEWVSGKEGSGPTPSPGVRNWITFDMQGGRAIKDELLGEGQCDISQYQDWVYAKEGGTGGAEAAWNTRFGYYAPSLGDWRSLCQPGAPNNCPDLTGYPYCVSNHVDGKSAYGNFAARRKANDPYVDGVCMTLAKNPNLQGGIAGRTDLEAAHFGRDRRIVTAPVVDCTTWRDNDHKAGAKARVLGWACTLMLTPINGPDDVALEFIGLASEQPCTTTGMPGGGGGGAFVAQLVR